MQRQRILLTRHNSATDQNVILDGLYREKVLIAANLDTVESRIFKLQSWSLNQLQHSVNQSLTETLLSLDSQTLAVMLRIKEDLNSKLVAVERSIQLLESQPHFAEQRTRYLEQIRLNMIANDIFPASSDNHKKLVAIDFSEEQLSPDEKKTFEKFCCLLSSEVMSEPVRIKNMPQYCFEKTWILRALNDKQQNPFTRGRLIANNLILDRNLQTEINAFVDKMLHSESKKQIKTLVKNTSFFRQMEDKYLEENRHNDSNLQHEYDKRFGLVVARPT